MQTADTEAAMKAVMSEQLYARYETPRPFDPGIYGVVAIEAVRGPDGVWVVEFEG